MIGYVTLGSRDVQKAAPFYDALANELGTPRMMESDSFIAWGKPDGPAGIGLTLPFNGEPASVGNGVMVALAARDTDQVRRLYEIALAHGGKCEGLRARAAKASMPPISAILTATSSTHS